MTDLLTSVEARTSFWWLCEAAGFAYFAYLAVRRFLGGKTRARASIIAFSLTSVVISVTAVLLRTDTLTLHDRLIELRTLLGAAALWWMILEFRRGNITVTERPLPAPEDQTDRELYNGPERREPGVPGRRSSDWVRGTAVAKEVDER